MADDYLNGLIKPGQNQEGSSLSELLGLTGTALGNGVIGAVNAGLDFGLNTDNNPYLGEGDWSGGGGGTANPDQAAINALRSKISGKGAQIDQIYQALFGDLDKLVTTRDKELEEQYGEQLKGAADQFAMAIPEIEGSYAAIGAADSTDNSDAKTKADKGFKETTKTIGKNKEADKAKLGQYRSSERAKFEADRNSARRAVAGAAETDDVDALRGTYNDIENSISNAGVTRATLGTDGAARDQVSKLTGDGGRYEAATNALDAIIKSSMSGAVKEAAVSAVTDSAGLSDEEKKKVQQTYGNVYSEQAAL